MEASVPPGGFEQIRGEELARMFNGILRARRIVQPLITLVLLYVIIADHARWRSTVLIATAVLSRAMAIIETRRMRRLDIARYRPNKFDAASLILFLGATIVTTGGPRSPMMIWSVAALIVVAICQERRTTMSLLVLVIVGGLAIALSAPHAPWMMPAVFVDGAGRVTPAYLVCWAVLFATFAVSAASIGFQIRGMGDSILTRSLEARDETLKVHMERMRDLTTLSGEIAHELKNPLASIKGLAQLIELDPARVPERVKVLQGEVERMRGVLDEFLNFSRPLVPLTQTEVNLCDLCRDVIDLHEGLSVGRRLVLVAPADDNLVVRCDRRKVKQILINLVQNAIEASPAGGEVRISVDQRNHYASVRIVDRGHGLAPDLATRVFDAGVTSKGQGSGLGLTIVRTLAEQHGGRVELSNRDGGGCVAELLLPVAGSSVEGAAGTP